MAEEKKNGIVVKDDHNEFELMLRFFGNEILAIKTNKTKPPASPSIPSIRFTALLIPIYHIINKKNSQAKGNIYLLDVLPTLCEIAGINIPQNKQVHVGLTYIYGIGDKFSKQICSSLEIPKKKKSQ